MFRFWSKSVSGFPLRVSITTDHAVPTAFPLLKPDVRISRIRLSCRPLPEACVIQDHSAFQRRQCSRRYAGTESVLWEIALQVERIFKPTDATTTGLLRSTGVTRRLHYYEPLRLPHKPSGGY